MEKVQIYERSAFYYETDRMDVIHHSNYIRWFEEARIHFMKNVGLRQPDVLWSMRLAGKCYGRCSIVIRDEDE